MRRAPPIFLLLLLLGGAAQAQREQNNLMEVEEEQKIHVLPQNILRKEEKRSDAINLRKKIIAELYKRDPNLQRKATEKKEKQQEKETESESFLQRQKSNQKRRRRPFQSTAKPENGDTDIYKSLQRNQTEKESEEGETRIRFKTQKQNIKVNEVAEVQNTKILPHPDNSRDISLQKTQFETPLNGGKLIENDHRTSVDEHILQTMASGREAIWRKLLERRPSFQAGVGKNKQKQDGWESLSEGSTGSSFKQALAPSDQILEPFNQSLISNLDQELSESMLWKQSTLNKVWPTKINQELQRSEDGNGGDLEGALELRLTTAAPLIVEDELLIKVIMISFKCIVKIMLTSFKTLHFC